MQWVRHLVFIMAICMCSTFVMADEKEDAWSQGAAAFNKQDYDAAFPAFLRAAELGHANAQFSVGMLYKIGYGTKKDLEKAFYWVYKGAEQDNPPSLEELGQMYEWGIGTNKDLHQAWFWYNKAAEKHRNLGYEGRRRLVEYGSSEAQLGRGIEAEIDHDVKTAKYFFGLAAAQGNVEARNRLNFWVNKEAQERADERAQQRASQPTEPECGWACMNARAAQEKLNEMRNSESYKACIREGRIGC